MKVKFDYIPVLEDYTKDEKLSLEAILKIFENAGNRHSDIAKDPILKGVSNGKAWVLLDWKIEILEPVSYGVEIYAETWLDEVKTPFGTSRNFLLYRKSDNKIMVRGLTKWVLLDINTGRPSKLSDDLIERYAPEPIDADSNFKIQKIPIPESYDFSTEIALRRSDIDFNCHVHNLCYLNYAYEVLPKELYDNISGIKNLRITYKTAITEGEKIVAKYVLQEDKHIVAIFLEDKLCTLLQLW